MCRVDIGSGEAQQIVCGAPNVSPGMKVPCALPGANLPGDFKIKLAKVRGIESSGVLCSVSYTHLDVYKRQSGIRSKALPPEDTCTHV